MKKLLFAVTIVVGLLGVFAGVNQTYAAPVPYGLSIGFMDGNGVYMYPLVGSNVFSLTHISFLTGTSHVGITPQSDQLVGDVNGDGWTDIVFADESNPGYIYTRLNNKNGTFSSEYITSPVAKGNYGFGWYDNERDHMGDVNGDGRADLVFMFRENGTNNGIYAYLSSGNGYFNPNPIRSLSGAISDAGGMSGSNTESQLQGDFNGDGLMDIMHSLESTNQVEVYLSKGNGTFSGATITTSMSSRGVGQDAGEVTVIGDVNGDGYDDIVQFASAFTRVRLGLGDGKFQTTPISDNDAYRGGLNGATQSFIADTNHDNFDDLIWVSENDGGSSKIVVVPSNGNGTFSAPITTLGAPYPSVNFGASDGEQTFIGHFLGSSSLSASMNISAPTMTEDGGTVRIYATLSGGTSLTGVTMRLTITGSAVSGADYSISSGTVYIAPGASSGFVLLTGMNDLIAEGNESVYVSVNRVDNAYTGTITPGIITITDDDVASVNVYGSLSGQLESYTNNILLFAVLSGNVTSTSDIDVMLSASGATILGQDYLFASGSVITIAAGNTAGSTAIQFINNNSYQGNREVVVSISAVTGAAIGHMSTLSIGIREDDLGGGKVRVIQPDICPNGDTSPTSYDGLCSGLSLAQGGTLAGTGSHVTGTEMSSTGNSNISDDPDVYNPIVPTSPITRMEDAECETTEDNDAYIFAKKNNITTMPTCKQANLDGLLLRKHAAKMIVNLAKNIFKKQPDTTRNCSFSDMADEDEEMNQYALEACQMGIMGLDGNGVPASVFTPNGILNKAQLATMLSRLLYGSEYNNNDCRYCKHADKLKEEGIITVTTDLTNPLRRGWAILMFMRVK